MEGFSGGSVVKKLPANAGDTGSKPDWEELRKEKSTTPVSLPVEILCTEGAWVGYFSKEAAKRGDMTREPKKKLPSCSE